MKNINVHLQYPWKFPDSTYYKSLIENKPEGINYLNISSLNKGATTSLSKFFLSNFIKKNIRSIISKVNFTKINAHLTKSKEGYELIHCTHCLSKNKNKPWITDIEGLFSLQIADELTKKGKDKIRKLLLRENCKKILPWTYNIKKELIREFPEIKDKVEVVYPAIPSVKNLNKSKNKKLKIIYVSRYFDLKGGKIALEVMRRLLQREDIECIVVSDVPEELKKEYKEIKIYNIIPQEELFKLMEKSDIFLYPSPVDTFGFSLLEAMSFGLPIVTVNANQTESLDEIVKHYDTGMIINAKGDYNYKNPGKKEERIIESLVYWSKILIIFDKLRKEMSLNCLNEIKNGKFSIKKRNEKLLKIYKEAIDNESVTTKK